MSRAPDSNPSADQSHSGGKWFEATEWTVILKARRVDGPGAAVALERFARNYWKPIFCFIRQKGYNKEDAEDLTQGFYQHFLGKHLLERVTEPSGKFRTFLLTCLNHFLLDEKQRRNALKREGCHQLIALDGLEEDQRNGLEPADHLTADQVYDRQWAAEIIRRAVERLREYYAEQEKLDLFEQLKNLQPGERGTLSCAQIGATLGMTEQAVKNARHAFQKRYSKYLHEEVGRTVGDITLIQEEMTHFSDALGH